jgi:hypothetical protein
MEDNPGLQRLLTQLLQVHDAAISAAEAAVAYHALAAAAHAADGLQDVDTLDRIVALARADLERLDRDEPSNRLASGPAASRGHLSVFQQLSVTAGGMRQRIAAGTRLREAWHHRPEPGGT